jgi:hypothetical protein
VGVAAARTRAALALSVGGALAGLAVLGAASSPAPAAPPAAAGRAAHVVATVVPVVPVGDGRPVVVRGSGPVRGTGPVRRFTVAVEGGIGVDERAFATAVEATLADARSWGARGRMSVQRVAGGPVAFRVVLASPRTTDRLCAPLRTGGTYSCGTGKNAVINAGRWLRGASAYGGDLAGYRQYVVNHEVGHTLGHGHDRCPSPGRLAPVMVQQTKGVGACRPNPWPYP